jgi:[histone H3]-lysine4 N-trimethyltransferase SETD1
MSRISSGSFADFFPSAPSVLQQKRKRGAHDRHAKSPTHANASSCLTPPTTAGGPREQRHVPHAEVVPKQELEQEGKGSSPEDNELRRRDTGDLLNGVGSASSLTSTASSVFSSNNNGSATVGYKGLASDLHALTPITNAESSPPGKALSPRLANAYLEKVSLARSTNHDRREKDGIARGAATITPNSTPPQVRLQARPGPGEVKGFKTTYDPELDPKLSSKDKKKAKVRRETFGQEVCNVVLCDRSSDPD